LTTKSADNDIREALVNSLRTDKNPAVLLAVLEGLKSYIREDVHVRDAIVECLMRDTNPGVRTKAISLLNPVVKDTSVREALKVLAQHDQDNFIRSESKRILANTPNLD
jgi:HEAT repeats